MWESLLEAQLGVLGWQASSQLCETCAPLSVLLQSALPALYRGHDAFLFTSKYEAWGMPVSGGLQRQGAPQYPMARAPPTLPADSLTPPRQVLEAMASGLAVVATETAGVCSFATHHLDCLLAPPGDAAQLAQHVLSVLEDPALRARLAAAARCTALELSPDRVADQLERVLYSLTTRRQELLALRLQCLPDTQRAAVAAVSACAGVAAQQRAAKQELEAAAAASQSALIAGQAGQAGSYSAASSHTNLDTFPSKQPGEARR